MGAEPVALIGRNGMGKTTLCKALRPARRQRPLDGLGQARRRASCTASRRTRSRGPGVGYVPQGRRLFPSLTVDEHLQIVGAPSKAAWTPERVYDLFPRLAERKHVARHALSGGEQQMLAIGRALLTNPSC